jgi:hypothetical protein
MTAVGALVVEVVSSGVGTQLQEPTLPTVRLALASERICVRELVRRTVTAQLDALNAGRERPSEHAQRLLARQYMTPSDVEHLAREGRVAFPARTREGKQPDVELEIARALRGFELRVFRVVVDGEMLMELDDELILTPDSKVTFLRLMPLVGG